MQKVLNWIYARFPLLTAAWELLWGNVAPKNFNFWYHFGALAGLVLVMQIITGIFLTMKRQAQQVSSEHPGVRQVIFAPDSAYDPIGKPASIGVIQASTPWKRTHRSPTMASR